jgi:hypothetical protein
LSNVTKLNVYPLQQADRIHRIACPFRFSPVELADQPPTVRPKIAGSSGLPGKQIHIRIRLNIDGPMPIDWLIGRGRLIVTSITNDSRVSISQLLLAQVGNA